MLSNITRKHGYACGGRTNIEVGAGDLHEITIRSLVIEKQYAKSRIAAMILPHNEILSG